MDPVIMQPITHPGLSTWPNLHPKSFPVARWQDQIGERILGRFSIYWVVSSAWFWPNTGLRYLVSRAGDPYHLHEEFGKSVRPPLRKDPSHPLHLFPPTSMPDHRNATRYFHKKTEYRQNPSQKYHTHLQRRQRKSFRGWLWAGRQAIGTIWSGV